jgi:hypothetical protein
MYDISFRESVSSGVSREESPSRLQIRSRGDADRADRGRRAFPARISEFLQLVNHQRALVPRR